MRTSVLIPAYNPDEKLIALVDETLKEGFSGIIIVNDGSQPASDPIFLRLAERQGVVILKHEANQGKGAALKTGFGYFLKNNPSDCGLVTADADGQHTAKNIADIAKELERTEDRLVLGSRNFNGKIPLRSLIGNKISILAFKLLFQIKVSDTQTGLRGIPRTALPDFLTIPYNRYEYETEMLIVAKKNKIGFSEFPIEAIYLDNNCSSHFNPVLDSFKIYFVLLRYVITSLITALADFLVFINIYQLLNNVLFSTYISRFFAIFINYFLLKKYVFYSREKVIATFPKYIALVVIAGFISSAIVSYLKQFSGLSIVTAKILAELVIYFFNFLIQKNLIFRNDTNER